MAQVSSLMLARFMRLPRRSADTWQGGILRMPMWVDGADGMPYRPWGGVWVSLDSGLANVKLSEAEAGEGAAALDALLELAFKFAQTRRPTRRRASGGSAAGADPGATDPAGGNRDTGRDTSSRTTRDRLGSGLTLRHGHPTSISHELAMSDRKTCPPTYGMWECKT
jgi:hypothetical protein